MANHVYRVFTSEDLFSTTIQTEPTVVVWSGTAGYGGNTNYDSGSLSLYSGVRSRTDVGTGSLTMSIYPLVNVDTNTIDRTIQVPDPYPHTASVRFFSCSNTPQDYSIGKVATDEKWYEEHHSVLRRTSQWYREHFKSTYQTADSFPYHVTGWHIPEMFYHRQIATGSVLMTVKSFIRGAYYGNDLVQYWVDDGLGRIWSVSNETSTWNSVGSVQVSGAVFYNEGLIVFTHTDQRWHQQLRGGEGEEPHVKLQFRSVNPIKTMVFMCRMAPGEVNASNNPTYYIVDETGKRWAHDWNKSNEATTYISAIGLYNEERQLVGVAKLAQPIRKRERDAVDIKLRLDL